VKRDDEGVGKSTFKLKCLEHLDVLTRRLYLYQQIRFGEDNCRELTTLWVARLNDGAELKVTDPEEQHRDVDEEETEDEKRREWVGCGGRRAGCC